MGWRETAEQHWRVDPCLSKGGKGCRRDKSRNRSRGERESASLYLEREVKTYNFVDSMCEVGRETESRDTVPIVEVSREEKPRKDDLSL